MPQASTSVRRSRQPGASAEVQRLTEALTAPARVHGWVNKSGPPPALQWRAAYAEQREAGFQQWRAQQGKRLGRDAGPPVLPPACEIWVVSMAAHQLLAGARCAVQLNDALHTCCVLGSVCPGWVQISEQSRPSTLRPAAQNHPYRMLFVRSMRTGFAFQLAKFTECEQLPSPIPTACVPLAPAQKHVGAAITAHHLGNLIATPCAPGGMRHAGP